MKLEPSAVDLVATEALALAEDLPGGEARAAYQEIAWAAEHGDVPDELVERLGELVSLSLESGRARAVHGPEGVRALTAVWRETPQGRALRADLDDLNEALTALRGLPVEAVRVAAGGPGSYSVSIAAGDRELRLAVDRTRVVLRSVNVGGGGVGE